MGMFPCRICGFMWFSGGPPHRCFDSLEKALRALIAECEFANTRCVELHKHTAIDFQLLDEVQAALGERIATFCGGWPTLRDVAGRPVGKLIFDDDGIKTTSSEFPNN